METDYKELGPYIREVDIRNSDLKISLLLGVSIDKQFIPSIANTVGTDFRSYKIVKKGQFAYGPVTSRNGNKVSVALLNDVDECIISSSYLVFDILDKKSLLPEYLLLLFKNPEFDRYARFNSWGSAREVFSWQELCKTKLNIPSLKEQIAIVQRYSLLEKRILQLKKLNEKTLSYCDAMFEKFLENHKTTNKPIAFLGTVITGKTPSTSVKEYYDSKDVPFIKTPDMHEQPFIIKTKEWISAKGADSQKKKYIPPLTTIVSCIGSAGEISITTELAQTNQQINAVVSNTPFYSFFILRKVKDDLLKHGEGSTTMINVNKSNFESFEVPVPSGDDLLTIEKKLASIMQNVKAFLKEIYILQDYKTLIMNSVF